MIFKYNSDPQTVKTVVEVLEKEGAKKLEDLKNAASKEVFETLVDLMGDQRLYELNGSLIHLGLDNWYVWLDSEDEELLNQVDTLIKERLKKAS